MKFLVLLSFLFVGALATEEDPCAAEILRIRNAVVAHVNDDKFDYSHIIRELHKLHAEEITEAEFGTFIDEFCPKALEGTKFALEQVPTISEACTNDPAVHLKNNMIKFFKVVFGTFCSDNGKGYKDIAKNKGTQCFFGNEEYKQCFKTENTSFWAEDNFKDDHVCKFVKVHVDCEHFLDQCENHDVKTLQHAANSALKEIMKCTF